VSPACGIDFGVDDRVERGIVPFESGQVVLEQLAGADPARPEIGDEFACGLEMQPAHAPCLRLATESAMTQRSSNIRFAAFSAVCPLGSSAGATSQMSAPTRCLPRRARIMTWQSRTDSPPASGTPVPMAYAGSRASMSNET